MVNQQTEHLITQQFEHQIELYTHHGTGAHSRVVSYLVDYFKHHTSRNKKNSIVEFGGGNGALLDALKRKLPKLSLQLTNVELVEVYRKYQVNKDIQFIAGSILDSGFTNNSFDFIITRNLMHHLVSESLNQTRKNQLHALREMIRVVKPGGLILIEEQTNQSLLANFIIFFFSLWATKLKINIPALQITPYTHVGYLTQKELVKFVECNLNTSILFQDYTELHQPWWLKYPLLLFNNGLTFLSLKKR